MTEKKTTKSDAKRINKILHASLENIKPPEGLTVNEWADKYRILSSEASAEAGLWRTSRTPYLKAPMESFTDPKVSRIVMVAASQVGKSEFILNSIGYVIDQDPGSILYVQPTIEDAKKFSRLRITPMFRDTKKIAKKVSDVKLTGKTADTILQKSFPGGMLTIAGSNAPSGLASTPVRYVFGDERDRWATSAGKEGDPWELATARTTTFYNRKLIEVSTPTVKGASSIENSFSLGTQEYWCVKCPECGSYENIIFQDIRFDYGKKIVNGKMSYSIKGDVKWVCPHCGSVITEHVIRKQPRKWIAKNPDAYEKGIRSFWLNAFSSPWTPWSKICIKFLESRKDPEKLQVVYNTLLGELWEQRGNLADEDEMMARREDYGEISEGVPCDIPDGSLCLTMGVDTQDNRLEYEIVGWGHFHESWGIKKGVIMGRPSEKETWDKLTDIIEHVYRYKDGTGLRISITFIDSGGHYTQEVYEYCRSMFHHNVFAIKGKSADGQPYTQPPTKVSIGSSKKKKAYLYTIGVDSGKTIIMDALKVETKGPKYCHFPIEESKGYDKYYFSTLLSENLEMTKTSAGEKWRWVKLPGHERNEGLDCRNYAQAAFRILNPDMDSLERKIRKKKGESVKPSEPTKQKAKKARVRRSNIERNFDSW